MERKRAREVAELWGVPGDPQCWEDTPKPELVEKIAIDPPKGWGFGYRNSIRLGTYRGGWTYALTLNNNISGGTGPLCLYGERFESRGAAFDAAIEEARAWVLASLESKNSCRGPLTDRIDCDLLKWLDGLRQPGLF